MLTMIIRNKLFLVFLNEYILYYQGNELAWKILRENSKIPDAGDTDKFWNSIGNTVCATPKEDNVSLIKC